MAAREESEEKRGARRARKERGECEERARRERGESEERDGDAATPPRPTCPALRPVGPGCLHGPVKRAGSNGPGRMGPIHASRRVQAGRVLKLASALPAAAAAVVARTVPCGGGGGGRSARPRRRRLGEQTPSGPTGCRGGPPPGPDSAGTARTVLCGSAGRCVGLRALIRVSSRTRAPDSAVIRKRLGSRRRGRAVESRAHVDPVPAPERPRNGPARPDPLSAPWRRCPRRRRRRRRSGCGRRPGRRRAPGRGRGRRQPGTMGAPPRTPPPPAPAPPRLRAT